MNIVFTKKIINKYYKDYLLYKNKYLKNNQVILFKLLNNNYLNNINFIKLAANKKIKDIQLSAVQDIEKIKNNTLEQFFLDLLPIIDNLERTISTATNNSNKNIKNYEFNLNKLITEGINLILNELNNIIKKFKLEIIDSTNVIFDPKIHQAISIINDNNINNNYVINIFQKGYIFNNKLLRPAMVTVNKLD